MKRNLNSSKLSIINHKLSIAYGFTLIELLMVIIIISIVAASIMPVMGVIQRVTGSQASSRTIEIAVETARQLVNERVKKDKPVTVNSSPVQNFSIPWSGAAALFTCTGEIRFVVCDQMAVSNSLPGLTNSIYLGDPNNSKIYYGYKDVKGRDYAHLPNGRGVVGIIRTGDGLHLITPPFAVRFNKSGILVSGDPNSDSKSLIIYDGNYDDDFGNIAYLSKRRPSNYVMPSKDDLWRNKQYETAFEQIESVIGVVLFDPSSPNQVDLIGTSPHGYLSQTAQERILKRGKVMFFNRYSGVLTRRLSHEK